MQAIILAAGMGKRLGEYTKNNTKCMVEVNGIKLIDRAITQLAHFHLSRLVIVIGYKGNELKEYIGHRYDKVLKIEYIENKVYDKTNNIYSLALAKDELCKDDTILLESDIIFEDSVLQKLINDPYPNLALVDKYQSWMDGTMVTINENNEIENFINKSSFRYQDKDSYYKTVNLYKFSKEFSTGVYVPFLEAYCKVMGNNQYYEEVLRVLTVIHQSSLHALPLQDDKWYEIDDVQDLDIASTLFSSDADKFYMYHKRYGGFWRFPKLLDFCYLVNPYFPNERMIEEMKSNFEILLREYPSGMYVNSLLAAKYFSVRQEFIVVGNGAAELIKNVMEEHAGKKVGVLFPTFDEYPNRLHKDQIVAFVSQKDDFSYTIDDLINFFGDKDISLLLLINPDNPSGHFIEKKDLLKLISWCLERNIRIIVDESFVDFTDNYEKNSLLSNDILLRFRNLMVMKSISKSYGVPGLRLGILASADTSLIDRVKKEVSIWNINSFAEYYMQIFGKYESDYKKACRLFVLERELFYKDLQTISFLRVFPSQANFFLCEITNKYSSAELANELIKRDILISNCSTKNHMGETGKQLIRLAIRDREDDSYLIDTLHSLE
jgi:histidinol-phosphate/aromatic aminotransferase/cobyric acid decarboxylase-like protein/GTP:adenosylcobinamide-phosphate guanylyltransferase